MFYIRHEDLKVPENGVAVFGPFTEEEVVDRVNDAYADLLAQDGNVDTITANELDAEFGISFCYINSREYWMEQLAETEEYENA